MGTTDQILLEEFTALKSELIQKYDELGMRASGQWADALEVEAKNDTATIYGLEYSQQLESGRLPGKFPPSQAIEQWIIDKGISSRLEKKISISSLAFLIARKIAREGWKREQHGGVELISQVITEERIQKIIDRISEKKIIEFSNEIIGFIKYELAA